jgi:hypothetical protein
MKKILIASMREGCGKTSSIVGLMSASKKKFGYIKPFGDRLIYKRKRNWDYDSSLMIDIFGLDVEPENITLGFDHSKLRYVFDETSTKTTLNDMAETAGAGMDYLIIEGGKDLTYGSSIHLDSISVAKYSGAKMFILVSGHNDSVIDDIKFIKNNINLEGVDFGGVIINKVRDIDEFENYYLKEIEKMGINVAGVLPYKDLLTYFTISYLAEKLFAKVIAGESSLDNIVQNILVGAMSTQETLRNPIFNTVAKFLITSGDRSDMILAALEGETKGILLSNNIIPPSNIISKAEERKVPLLVVPMDTYKVAQQIDNMEALLTKDNKERLTLLTHMAEKYVKPDQIFG